MVDGVDGGIGFLEGNEIQESQEISEGIQQVNEVTFEPEAALEKNDYKPAEELQEAFTAAVPPAETMQVVDIPVVESTESDRGPNTQDQSGAGAGDAPLPPSAPPDGSEQGSGSEGDQLVVAGANPFTADSASFSMETAADQVTEASDKLNGFSLALEAANEKEQEAEAVLAEAEAVVAEEGQKATKPESQKETSQEEIPNKTDTQKAATTPEAESSLDGKTHHPSDHYSGVNQIQGEVAQDSDWNDNGDHTQDMSGAESGEVRGFDDGSEQTPYILEALGDTGEGNENQIVIPAGNSQIDFAGALEEIQGLEQSSISENRNNEMDAYSNAILRGTSEILLAKTKDSEERSSNPGIDKLVEVAAVKAESAAAEIEDIAAKQAEMQEKKEEIREGKSTFDEIVIDSPAEDLGLRKTADDLIDEIDSSEISENSDTSIILEAGSLLVGEAVSEELASDMDLDLEIEEMMSDQDQVETAVTPMDQIERIADQLENYEETIKSINEQISTLKDIQQALEASQTTLSAVLVFAEKQSDGTYKMVPKAIHLTADTATQWIKTMEATRSQIYAEAQALKSQLPFGNIGEGSDEMEMLANLRSQQNDAANQQAQEDADAAQAAEDEANNWPL